MGCERHSNGKAKHGEAWKRNRKATQRTATELKSDDTLRNGTESLRQEAKRKSKNTAPAESGRKEDNMKIDTNKYYIVRGDRSGVFFGRINYQDGKEVQMNDVRCIWYWSGAASIVELAQNGVKYPENCKFTVAVEEITITDAVEMIPCTDKSTAIIKAVKEWQA